MLVSITYVLFSMLVFALADEGDLKTQAWRTTAPGGVPPQSYPETELLKDKPNTAIAFSGGGSRSYVASMGELAALTQLGLMDKVRYVAGISGGSWATLTYSFSQNDADGGDDVLLGPITAPGDLTSANLKEMDPGCARGFASSDVTGHTLKGYKSGIAMGEAWSNAVSQAYLEPVGIQPEDYFTVSPDSESDIKARNPSLGDAHFVHLANAKRPFPIVASTLVGPSEFMPYRTDNHNYSYCEITPMYVGQMRERLVSYHSPQKLKFRRSTGVQQVGGAVEPFAVGVKATVGPTEGVPDGQPTATLDIPPPSQHLDLRFAAGASGYAPGSFVESTFSEKLKDTSLFMSYWSPASAQPEPVENVWADGGSTDNLLLMGLLQRKVSSIVLFSNCHQPLQPSDKWDVTTDPYSTTSISDDLGFYFGVTPDDYKRSAPRFVNYEVTQVFSADDWPGWVQGLQASQAEGNGIVYTATLTTIQNDLWGIPAGLEVTLTTVYLGRSLNWEAQLPEELQALVVPQDPEAATNPAETVGDGPYKDFPHYATTGGMLSHERANLLAQLTAFQVLEHKDIFEKVLS